MDKLKEILITLRSQRDQLRCPKTKRLAQAVNIGDDYKERPLLCSKCLISYRSDIIGKEYNFVPIDEFFETIEQIIQADGNPMMTTSDIQSHLVRIFEGLYNQTLETTLPAIEAAVEASKQDLIKNVKQTLLDLKKTEDTTNLKDQDPRCALMQAFSILQSNKTLQINSEIKAISQQKTEDYGYLLEKAAAITNKTFAPIARSVNLPPIFRPNTNVMKNQAERSYNQYQIDTISAFEIKSYQKIFFYGFSLSKTKNKGSFAEIMVYKGKSITPKDRIASLDVLLSTPENTSYQIASQTSESQAVVFGKPLPMERGTIYTIVVDIYPRGPHTIYMNSGNMGMATQDNQNYAVEVSRPNFDASGLFTQYANLLCDLFLSKPQF